MRAVACGFTLGCLLAQLAPYQERGGSNYGWYRLGPDCQRGPYGVIPNYDTAAAEIDHQLEAMYRNGQRRLRIPIYHGRGIGGGTVLDSKGGELTTRGRQNLRDLLAKIRSAGFVEILVTFVPTGANDPARWTAFQQDYYDENWALIRSLRPLIAAAGIPYRIDLWNEGSPHPRQRAALEYCQRLWNQYGSEYGTDDTVGFSIIPDPARLELVASVYGDTPFGNHGDPPAFDLHFYASAQSRFEKALEILNTAGRRQPWILGEAYCNDSAEAQALRQEIDSTGKRVLFLLQWPLEASSSCRDVSIAPPVDFGEYIARGF